MQTIGMTMRELSPLEMNAVGAGFTWSGFLGAVAIGGISGALAGSVAAGVGAGPGALGGALLGGIEYSLNDLVEQYF